MNYKIMIMTSLLSCNSYAAPTLPNFETILNSDIPIIEQVNHSRDLFYIIKHTRIYKKHLQESSSIEDIMLTSEEKDLIADSVSIHNSITYNVTDGHEYITQQAKALNKAYSKIPKIEDVSSVEIPEVYSLRVNGAYIPIEGDYIIAHGKPFLFSENPMQSARMIEISMQRTPDICLFRIKNPLTARPVAAFADAPYSSYSVYDYGSSFYVKSSKQITIIKDNNIGHFTEIELEETPSVPEVLNTGNTLVDARNMEPMHLVDLYNTNIPTELRTSIRRSGLRRCCGR